MGSQPQRSPIKSVSWTRDGQLITSAGATGLSLLNPDSGAKTPFLSQLPLANLARACSDGDIVFAAPRGEKRQVNIWQADCCLSIVHIRIPSYFG
jgi:hypothetical protein